MNQQRVRVASSSRETVDGGEKLSVDSRLSQDFMLMKFFFFIVARCKSQKFISSSL